MKEIKWKFDFPDGRKRGRVNDDVHNYAWSSNAFHGAKFKFPTCIWLLRHIAEFHEHDLSGSNSWWRTIL